MTDHDMDLILGLIDGTLSDSDAAVARSRLSEDAAFAAEYQAQMSVRSALTAVEPVAMTSDERDVLRASLTAQLHLDGANAPATEPARSGRKLWWGSLTGFAAAAAAVTVFVVMPSSSDDAASEESFVATADAPTQSITSDAADGAGAESNDLDLFEDGEPVLVVDLEDATPEDLLTVTKGRSAPDDIQGELEVAGYQNDLTIDGSTLEVCLETIQGQLPPGTTQVHLLGAAAEPEATTVYLGLIGTGEAIDTVLSLDLDDCSFTTSTNGLDSVED